MTIEKARNNEGIADVCRGNVINVYPNPTKGVLNINAGNSSFSYSLFNGMGQEVAKGTAQGSQQLHVSDMAKGVYFLRLTSGNQVSIQKIVVE